MKITVLKEHLLGALGITHPFTAQKAQLPLLSNVCLQVVEKEFFIVATDLSRGIRVRVQAKVEGEGGCGVQSQVLLALVQSLPMGPVEMMLDEQGLRVMAKGVRATLPVIGTDEFPQVGEMQDDGVLIGQVDKQFWSLVVSRIGFSASRDDTRPILTGVYWDLKKGVLAATDGYRLSVLSGKGKIQSDHANSILLPARLWQDVDKVFGEAQIETLNVSVIEGSEVMFEGDGVLIVGRVIEGDYPDFAAIVPKAFEIEVGFQRSDLLQAVKSASIFAQDSAHIIRFGLEKDGVNVSANAPQVGQGTFFVEYATGAVEEEMAIAFNAKFVQEALQKFEGDRVVFRMNEPLQPGMLVDSAQAGYYHVVMPVRVRE